MAKMMEQSGGRCGGYSTQMPEQLCTQKVRQSPTKTGAVARLVGLPIGNIHVPVLTHNNRGLHQREAELNTKAELNNGCSLESGQTKLRMLAGQTKLNKLPETVTITVRLNGTNC